MDSPVLDVVRHLLGVKVISLQPFDMDETRDFSANYLHVNSISEFIGEQIFSRTGGIALYIELLQSLLAGSTLVVENGMSVQ